MVFNARNPSKGPPAIEDLWACLQKTLKNSSILKRLKEGLLCKIFFRMAFVYRRRRPSVFRRTLKEHLQHIENLWKFHS